MDGDRSDGPASLSRFHADSPSATRDAFYLVYREWNTEYEPDDPIPSEREMMVDLFALSDTQQSLCVVAEIDGEPAGTAWAVTASAPDDPLQVADAEVYVRPKYRRRGLGDQLTLALFDSLVDAGQNSVLGWPCREVVYESALALCRKHGLEPKSYERCSRAALSEIDPAMLESWRAEGGQRAVGYRLEQWIGECPDHLAALYAQALEAMDDEPHGLDYNPYVDEIEVQNAADRHKASLGVQAFRTLCLASDGTAAGLSWITVHEDRPQLGHQQDTAVLAGHRGRRIGRWMKAANLQFVLAHHPELTTIETYNNEDNPWMLAINEAMAFKPHRQFHAHQGPLPLR